MSVRVAVFDVDETLVRGSAGGCLVDALWKSGLFTASHKRFVMGELVKRRLGAIPTRRIVELGSRMLFDLDVDRVRAVATRCVEESLSRRIYREALDEIADARARGLRVLLASGSPSVIIEPLAAHVGAELGIGSHARIDPERNTFTRHVEQPLPYKEGKRDRVIEALDGEPVDWRASVAYSDLAIDVPLFEHVGRAVAVNPRGALKRMAPQRGWEIRHWRTTLAG